MDCILLTIYVHPEYYPPTLNAISELAKKANKVIVITQKASIKNWKFPSNVEILSAIDSGNSLSLSRFSIRPIIGFCKYCKLLQITIGNYSPNLIVAHDPMALAGIWILNLFGYVKAKVWYHNHDILNNNKSSLFGYFKYSMLKWVEKKSFKFISIFSLPSNERKPHFPLKMFKGKYLFLPNFPARSFTEPNFRERSLPEKTFKLIYQGQISYGHGLEKVINLLNENILGLDLNLTLIGNCNRKYKSKLLRLASENNSLEKLFFLDRVEYRELPAITIQHHLGLAMHQNVGPIYSTGATASNKIYEYCALGLPVLLHNNPHYKKYLSQFDWAFFSEISESSIIESIGEVITGYKQLSEEAHSDFLAQLNFEDSFDKSFQEAKSSL